MSCDEEIKRWLSHGRPKRSAEQMQVLYDEHCAACDQRRAKFCQAAGEACLVEPAATADSLLFRATSHCPLDLW